MDDREPNDLFQLTAGQQDTIRRALARYAEAIAATEAAIRQPGRAAELDQVHELLALFAPP